MSIPDVCVETDTNSDCDPDNLVDTSVSSFQPADDSYIQQSLCEDDQQSDLPLVNQLLRDTGKTPITKRKLRTKKYADG